MRLTGKIIYLISREGWGGMLMSKQHYALELARRGNVVYFINHPDLRRRFKRGSVVVEQTDYENVYSVNHRLFHPYFLKDRNKRIYDFFTGFHIRKLIRKIGKNPDVIWTFDVGNALPVRFFDGRSFKIFMPVDGPFGIDDEIRSAKQANVIISITKEILETYKDINIPKLRINHGVAGDFINEDVDATTNSPIRVGYSGSLVRNDLDIDNFIRIIEEHQDKTFEFWGEHDYMKSNIHLPQDVSLKTKQFIEKLKNYRNVKLHGAVRPEILAKGIKNMDVLLICYKLFYQNENLRNDQNHHKVLEYLGTGKIIVSSFMSVYSIEYPGLMEMTANGEGNDEIPFLFNKVVKNLDYFNGVEKQRERINFAKQFTYSRQVENIESFVNLY